MAPVKNKLQKTGPSPIFTMEFYKKYLFDPHYLTPACILLFVFEVFLNVFIIQRVNYTEIDWIAYMQEVEGFLNGTFDYQQLKGDTGPLVYPAGFVYIYSFFYYITENGRNIRVAQYIFLVLYLCQTLLNYRILKKTAKIPPYALALATLTSYRIHSIFVLRLFNDPIAVIFFYISLNLFISECWYLGSFFYSIAVSIKMNILLYAPALLIAYLTNLSLTGVVTNLGICGLVQLILGAPFLISYPFSYIKGSFDLGRIFEHQWTVNYRFLPQHIFTNRYFHLFLLLCHILTLLIFLPHCKRYLSSYAKLKTVTVSVQKQFREERRKRLEQKKKELESLTKQQKQFLQSFEKQIKVGDGQDREEVKLEDRMSKVAQLFVLPFFVANLIGMTFARSLHYQFYSWYFHSLLYLVFSTGFRRPVNFLLLGILEYCWNVYPSTEVSSGLLHCCHFVLLYGVYRTMKM